MYEKRAQWIKKIYIPENIDLISKEMWVFDLLYRNKGELISIEDIYNSSFMSRKPFQAANKTAVWVTISRMRSKGIEIENVPDVGYRIAKEF